MRPRRTAEELYDDFEPKAKRIKAIIHFGIGVAIVFLVFVNIALALLEGSYIDQYIEARFSYFVSANALNGFVRLHPLEVASFGLAVAAGIELAYLLFTDGPDEAIDPVMLGISSSILLILAGDNKWDWEIVLTIAVLVASMIGLFWARKAFELKNDPKSTPTDE